MSRPHLLAAALPVAIIAAGVVSLSSCSGPSPAPQASPTIDFESASATPGMPGMSAMPSAPATDATAPAPAGTDTAAAEAPAAPQGPNTVSITNFAFSPATLTVPAGTKVTWTNHDEEPHTVVANDDSFHSPGLGTNSSYSYTFTTAGTFDYVCSIHPFMRATVVVTK